MKVLKPAIANVLKRLHYREKDCVNPAAQRLFVGLD